MRRLRAAGRAAAARAASGSAAGLQFNGVHPSASQSQPTFQDSGNPFPILRQTNPDGTLLDGVSMPCSWETARRMYGCMVRSSTFDKVLNDMQRQGRVSFYCCNYGEEAASVGSAAALQPQDMIWPQYRELGMFLWRGLSAEAVVDACIGNEGDAGKGRNLPVHYMLPDANVQAVHAVLGTQVPQAPGAGYAYKMKKEDRVSVAYFGDGAASEGDALSALNYASVFGSQTIFICRNNGYSISTPVKEQYAGDGICARGAAFGIHSIRVDGNDAVAVFNATAAARELCVRERRPVVMELMTYRIGHHTTSDDSSLYRPTGELQEWEKEGVEPISRFRALLERHGEWSVEREQLLRKAASDEIRQAVKVSEAKLSPNPSELFTDMYDDPPWHLKEQEEELTAHIARHRDSYRCSRYRGL